MVKCGVALYDDGDAVLFFEISESTISVLDGGYHTIVTENVHEEPCSWIASNSSKIPRRRLSARQVGYQQKRVSSGGWLMPAAMGITTSSLSSYYGGRAERGMKNLANGILAAIECPRSGRVRYLGKYRV